MLRARVAFKTHIHRTRRYSVLFPLLESLLLSPVLDSSPSFPQLAGRDPLVRHCQLSVAASKCVWIRHNPDCNSLLALRRPSFTYIALIIIEAPCAVGARNSTIFIELHLGQFTVPKSSPTSTTVDDCKSEMQEAMTGWGLRKVVMPKLTSATV